MTTFNKIEAKKENLLVYGYIRDNCKWNVPMMLKKWFMAYYNEDFEWKFIGTELEQLLKKEKNEFKTTRFTVKGASFYAKLLYDQISNGWHGKETLLFFGFELEKLDSNIKSMVIYYELKCLQTKTDYKSILRLDADDDIDKDDDILWDQQTAKSWKWAIQQFKNENMTFKYYVKPLRIIYNDNTPDFNRNVEIKKRCEFKLNLTKEDIEKFANIYRYRYNNIRDRKYYFPNPNGYNWLVYLTQIERYRVRREYEWNIGIQLLGLPKYFDKMSIEVSAYKNGKKIDEINTRKRHIFGYCHDENASIDIEGRVLKDDDFLKPKPIELMVKLNIRSAETKTGQQIPKLQLNQYGIV